MRGDSERKVKSMVFGERIAMTGFARKVESGVVFDNKGRDNIGISAFFLIVASLIAAGGHWLSLVTGFWIIDFAVAFLWIGFVCAGVMLVSNTSKVEFDREQRTIRVSGSQFFVSRPQERGYPPDLVVIAKWDQLTEELRPVPIICIVSEHSDTWLRLEFVSTVKATSQSFSIMDRAKAWADSLGVEVLDEISNEASSSSQT